jgi:hypothetical protein
MIGVARNVHRRRALAVYARRPAFLSPVVDLVNRLRRKRGRYKRARFRSGALCRRVRRPDGVSGVESIKSSKTRPAEERSRSARSLRRSSRPDFYFEPRRFVRPDIVDVNKTPLAAVRTHELHGLLRLRTIAHRAVPLIRKSQSITNLQRFSFIRRAQRQVSDIRLFTRFAGAVSDRRHPPD